MKKVAFLYPTKHPTDALVNWVHTIARFTYHYQVHLAITATEALKADYIYALTATCYPPSMLDADLRVLREAETLRGRVRFGVIHNEDWGIPAPGAYPSFCWTQTSKHRLIGYSDLKLLRQPVLPRLAKQSTSFPNHFATFGHCEPKKQTLGIARWARSQGIPFTVFAPDVLLERYEEYIVRVRREGATVITHPWLDRVEDLGAMFTQHEVSHFIFVLPPTKGGTGGSSTSPRYATAFGKPVIVIDDELTLSKDGFYIYDTLEEIDCKRLQMMSYPLTVWSPDQYITELNTLTEAFWVKASQ